MPRLAAVLAATLAVVLAAPAASADAALRKGIWGPPFVPSGPQGVSQFDRYRDLGVDVFNIQLVWADTAPTRPANPRDPSDPAYRWLASTDRLLSEARRTGIEVSFLVRGTPSWANGGKDETWAPRNRKDYADFLAAASRRYRQVRLWQIWGEPNGGSYQWQPRRGAARAYGRLLDAAYVTLKGRSRRNLVIGGMSQAGRVEGDGDTPARWVRAIKYGKRRPRMDMYGHNPFQQARRPRLRDRPRRPGWRDLSDLDTFIREVDRYHRRPGGRRKLKLYLSEWSVWSDRPGPSNWFVDQQTQARWLADGFRLAKRNRRVYHLGWFRLTDNLKDGQPYDGFGLMTHDFVPKPAYQAFKRQ